MVANTYAKKIAPQISQTVINNPTNLAVFCNDSSLTREQYMNRPIINNTNMADVGYVNTEQDVHNPKRTEYLHNF